MCCLQVSLAFSLALLSPSVNSCGQQLRSAAVRSTAETLPPPRQCGRQWSLPPQSLQACSRHWLQSAPCRPSGCTRSRVRTQPCASCCVGGGQKRDCEAPWATAFPVCDPEPRPFGGPYHLAAPSHRCG